MLELLERDGLARICKFSVNNKEVETPTLMPVINPGKIVISPRDIYEKFKLKSIITNSYIIYNNNDLKEKALTQKLHKMLDYPGIIMTDSGTFQDHVYGNLELDPQKILDFQREIGADIGTILDIFTEPDFSREQALSAIEETARRGAQALKIKGNMKLAGTVQGSVYLDLREYAAQKMSALEFDYYPIGGVVPLLESYRYSDIVDILIASKLNLDPSKPVHLFGAGHPMFFAMSILLGVDFFDSSSYIKYARDNRFLFPDGTRELKDMKYVPYYSPVLDKYEVSELAQMPYDDRVKLIAEHNLFISVEELNRVKTAIFEQSIWEYVEERSRSHPALYSALKTLKKYQEKLERFENLSRKHAYFYTSIESLNRPVIYRLDKRIRSEFQNEKTVVVLNQENIDKMKQYIETANATFLVHTPFGFIPYQLMSIYPILQSSFPDYPDKIDNLKHIMDSWDLDTLISRLKNPDDPIGDEFITEHKKDLDIEKIRAIVDYQFGKYSSNALFNGPVKIVKSKNTGMIRTVFLDDKHILSMRNDGFFTLKYEAGKLLHAYFKYPKLRIAVSKDSAEFNMLGKNVFARFVVDMDPDLIPYDEVLIVDPDDNYIGVGRTFMNKTEALKFKKGMVAEVRETNKK
ncbi:MAG: tRNA guanosine(15) transglycosylase TgtA [Thermoplasmata archaeon]